MTSDRRESDCPISVGRGVVRAEAEALQALASGLGESFADAVTLLGDATGRVIVSGMGKSGHVGRKIAATLSSVGQPCHFVHPAEASHGDLGMVLPDDVLLILSNSGETPELSHIVLHAHRHRIPVIAVVGKPDSTLAKRATTTLCLPESPEACGVGIVPTVSTTMMLALGDALAVALMRQTGFSPEQFRTFHPGGKLGARLSQVRDLMHEGDAIPIVRETTMMTEVLLVMTKKSFGVAGIVDRADNLVGIITDGDLRRHMDNLLAHSAMDVMTPNPLTIRPDALAEEAVTIMNQRGITCLFVCDPKQRTVRGVLHIHDCLKVRAA